MDEYRTRVRIYAGVVLAIFVLLGLRLVQLQGLGDATDDGIPPGSAVRKQAVEPTRGAMYDRDGTLLVDNRPTYTIRLTPRYFDRAKAPLLADLLGVADSTVRRKLQAARKRNAFRPTPSFREVPFETFSRVQEHLYELPGVSYDVEMRRRYHTAAEAAHVLGYVHEIGPQTLARRQSQGYRSGDRIGKTGLEKAYESVLRGERGHEFVLVNVHGTEVMRYRDGAKDKPAVSGYDLHLTLDHQLQAFAESLFVNKRGAAVALDPDTGEILSLVSTPDFDPSLFAQSVRSSVWDSLRSAPHDPLFNRATQSGYPPGSTWKPFMALVALETGILSANERLDCPSTYRIGQGIFKNHNMMDEGMITVKKAIEVSCNTFFYQVMDKMSLETWHDWALKFGFGQEVPLNGFRQSPGLIPDSSYFDRTYGRWTQGYTINLGIGQGDMSTTPLQLARYAAALGNGGTLPPPHFVRKAVHPETGKVRRPELPAPDSIPIDPAHFNTVQKGMHRVMTKGTGRWVQIPNVPSAGKTGTAQNPHGEPHSLFIMFAPYKDPEIALAVVVENAGYGATAAAPIASLMAEKYLTGTIADTWQRRYWQRRLREEVQSGPGKKKENEPSPSEPAPVRPAQAPAQPSNASPDSARSETSLR
ncbi:MAG: penicillin-binding protein 2 [Salinibacter sp.]